MIVRRPLLLALFALCQFSVARPAHAFCLDCSCAIAGQATVVNAFDSNETATQNYFLDALHTYEQWLDNVFYGAYLRPAMQKMTTQLSSVMVQETMAIGGFLDAQTQAETQTLFQELTARAHKDYAPSFGMCVFGTNLRGLAASEANAGLTQKALSRQGQSRELESNGPAGSEGPRSDRDSRLAAFANRYCDRFDNNANAGDPLTGLGKICTSSPTAATLNKDIDYMRTLLLPRTLDIDFSDNKLTGDEQDVIAMRQNLYSHQLFQTVNPTKWAIDQNRPTYLDMRAVIAKRSVAENSFDAITAMKSGGGAPSEETAKYMGVLLQELGMPAADITHFLGARPSYLAQLEVLAKKMYQRPEFYTELYEAPANVARRGVAMQAIGTMLDRDIYKSHLRSEAILSLILEARLQPLQNQVGKAAGELPKSAP